MIGIKINFLQDWDLFLLAILKRYDVKNLSIVKSSVVTSQHVCQTQNVEWSGKSEKEPKLMLRLTNGSEWMEKVSI